MGNRRYRRSRTPDGSLGEMRVDTPNQCNETLTAPNNVIHNSLGDDEITPQLFEPSQVSKEIQVWTEIIEQKNNGRIMKTKEEMENKI